MLSRRLLCVVACCLGPAALICQTKQTLTPTACTEIRYLAPEDLTMRPALQLSHDGKQISYIVQVPNLDSDEYENELYVVADDGTGRSQPRLMMRSAVISAATWFPDNRHLAALISHQGRIVLADIDSVTTQVRIIRAAEGDITDYTSDAKADIIAIAVNKPLRPINSTRTMTERRNGYHLDLNAVAPPDLPRRQIYILRRTGADTWTAGPPVSFVSPFSGKQLDNFASAHDLHIDLSPNGRHLLIDNIEPLSDALESEAWKSSREVNFISGLGGIGVLNYLYDVNAQNASMPVKSPIVRDKMWAPDGKSYVVRAVAPVGSQWEEKDLMKDAPSDHLTHLFSVNVETSVVSEVLERSERLPLGWNQNGEMEVQDQTGTIRSLYSLSGKWVEKDSFHIPLPDMSPYLVIVSNGSRFVLEYQNASTAPEIVAFDRSSSQAELVTKLNPQVDRLLLPRIEHVTWSTSNGYQAKGLLLLPPDYDPSRRYPVVIENGSILDVGEFVCDAGVEHVSSFARGLLADAGVIYLIRSWPGINDWKNNYYPKGYPGQIDEAAFQLDLVESAVRYLDGRHMIDLDRVGLIGFSRGGWYTEYALMNSHIKFAAATATDNILYSLGEYWLFFDDRAMHLYEGMYGGPPYGASFTNWLKYSISFNLDKIHTPLLMEEMGYGEKDSDPTRPSNYLAKHLEEYVGLSRLHKPVELYYYPLEQHQMDHPLARIAALQRNVDWYRFWLQGYERPNPEDPGQYKRWEHLRELRDADRNTVGTTTTR